MPEPIVLDVAQGCEHGSHVAGIAAGYQASGSPPNGVAPSAEIFSSQIFTKVVGPPVDLTAFNSDLLASLNDLLTRVNNNDFAAKPLVAINISLGDSEALFTGDCDSDARTIPFKSVIDALRAKNVATVIASGNDGETNRTSFPGCISTAVTVSSTTKSDGVLRILERLDDRRSVRARQQHHLVRSGQHDIVRRSERDLDGDASCHRCLVGDPFRLPRHDGKSD